MILFLIGLILPLVSRKIGFINKWIFHGYKNEKFFDKSKTTFYTLWGTFIFGILNIFLMHQADLSSFTVLLGMMTAIIILIVYDILHSSKDKK